MILSIDVGIRNLAMCLLNETNNLVEEWDVSGVPPEHKDGIYVSLRNNPIVIRKWFLWCIFSTHTLSLKIPKLKL